MPILHVRDVPANLYQKIRKLAALQRRSLSAQVVTLLDRAVDEENRLKTQSEILKDLKQNRAKLKYVHSIPDSVSLLREDRAR